MVLSKHAKHMPSASCFGLLAYVPACEAREIVSCEVMPPSDISEVYKTVRAEAGDGFKDAVGTLKSSFEHGEVGHAHACTVAVAGVGLHFLPLASARVEENVTKASP